MLTSKDPNYEVKKDGNETMKVVACDISKPECANSSQMEKEVFHETT
jgi:hypothetical protein